MLIANNKIFNSKNALNGTWRNIQNWICFSLHVTGLEGNVWVEVSNDPNVLTDGATHISAPAQPTLSQYTPTADSGISGVPVDTTYYVKTTYTTPSSFDPTGTNATFRGETLPSSESSLLVKAGNLLVVESPAQDTGGVASGWNCYIGTSSGTETLQNLEDNAVVHPLEIGQSFVVVNWGLLDNDTVVPASDSSSTANSGFNLTGNLAATSYAAPTSGTGLNQVQVLVDANGNAIINPSGIIWNFIRVCKDSTANTKTTTAYLFGQSS